MSLIATDSDRVMDDRPGKVHWVSKLPSCRPDKVVLGRLVEENGAPDAAEVAYYEAVADPT